MAKHIMVDLETLATTPDSVILTIGAFKFDPWGPNVDRSSHNFFYRRVDTESCEKLGMVIDPGTLEWWGNQKPEIIDEAFNPEDRMPVSKVIDEFHKFAWGCDAFWSHGSIFDIMILETYFRKLKKNLPWNFWQIRDTRTIFDLGYDPEMPKNSKHNALEDAYNQAVGVQNMFKKVARRN
jgi:exodeoxyribonuclease VIII